MQRLWLCITQCLLHIGFERFNQFCCILLIITAFSTVHPFFFFFNFRHGRCGSFLCFPHFLAEWLYDQLYVFSCNLYQVRPVYSLCHFKYDYFHCTIYRISHIVFILIFRMRFQIHMWKNARNYKCKDALKSFRFTLNVLFYFFGSVWKLRVNFFFQWNGAWRNHHCTFIFLQPWRGSSQFVKSWWSIHRCHYFIDLFYLIYMVKLISGNIPEFFLF